MQTLVAASAVMAMTTGLTDLALAQEASKKAARSTSDNENFITVKTFAIVSGVRFVANELNHFFLKPLRMC